MGSDDELLSIGRFAQQARLSIHRLRRYHDLGLLEPALVDAESGYRYYSPAQVARAEAIAVLRSLELPLAEVQRLLEDPSDDHVARVLAQHRERLEERLEEARERLRRLDQLADERRWTVVAEDAGKEEATELVEVRLDHVRRGAVGDPGRDEMMLVEVGGPRILTIWIGPTEAEAINARLHGITRERPLTHDLMANLLRPFDVDVVKVVVSRLDNQVFLAEVHLRRQGREVIIDARPSDAVSLAVRTAAPIFVAAPVFAAEAALKSLSPDVPPRPDSIHFELVDEAGSQIMQGWMAPSAEMRLGPFEVHGARGQVTTYEILEVHEAGERRVRAVVRLVSRTQRKWDVPN